MSHINPAAAAAREHAREANGQFGCQQHSTPDVAPAEGPLTAGELDLAADHAEQALLWSSVDDDGVPFDQLGYDPAPQVREYLRTELSDFCVKHADLVREARERSNFSDSSFEEQFGHDYVLTAMRHGAGFWDRESLKQGGLGVRLTEAVQQHSRLEYADLYEEDGEILLDRN